MPIAVPLSTIADVRMVWVGGMLRKYARFGNPPPSFWNPRFWQDDRPLEAHFSPELENPRHRAEQSRAPYLGFA
jgi:hypothetical protein